MRKLFALLLVAAVDAGAAERLLTAPAYDGLQAWYQPPAIATDGTSFLSAWIAMPGGRSPAIMVRRLDAGLTAVPDAIVTDPNLADGRIELAWSNASYLLVWNSGRELHAMRLGRDGQPVAGSARILATDLRDAAIATNGAATVVVARDDVADQIVALTLDADDAVAKRMVIWSQASVGYAAVARDGGFTVAFIDTPGIAAMRFDTAGNPIDAGPRTIVTFDDLHRPQLLALGSRGDETLIVWSSTPIFSQGDFMPGLFAAVFSPSGSVGATVTLPQPGFVNGIDVASDAAGYTLLVSGTPYESAGPAGFVEVLETGADGAPASGPRPVAYDGLIDGAGRLARNDAGFGVVWLATHQDYNIFSGQFSQWQRIEGGSTATLQNAVAPMLLSCGTTEQRVPAIASNGSGYLVAWVESSLAFSQVRAVPLDRNGAPAAPPVALSAAAPSSAIALRVVFGGVYLVTWISGESLWAMRLDANGHPLDAAPIPLSGGYGGNGQYDVTATANGFFAAWHTWAGSIYGAALTSAGPTAPQKLTEHAPGSTANSVSESDPHLGFNGDTLLLAYLSWPSSWELMRVGAPGDLHPLDGAVLSIASDGRDFAILQQSHLLRVDAQTLSVKSTLDIAGSRRPALTWNGTRYIVVTGDDDAGGAAVTACDVTPQWTLGGARTTTIDPLLYSADFTANGAGDVFAAYARGIAEQPFLGASRAAVQPVGDLHPVRRRASGRP